jgi:hypothetical protein
MDEWSNAHPTTQAQFLSPKNDHLPLNLMMEQRVLIKITLEDGLNAIERRRKLVRRSAQEARSYDAVTFWRCEFCAGRQDVDDNL